MSPLDGLIQLGLVVLMFKLTYNLGRIRERRRVLSVLMDFMLSRDLRRVGEGRMTVSRATATVTSSIDDFFFQIALAADLGSIEMRKTGYVAGCDVCGETVELVEDKIERLTSYGTARTWRMRRPYTHSRECYQAHHERLESRAVLLDPWA